MTVLRHAVVVGCCAMSWEGLAQEPGRGDGGGSAWLLLWVGGHLPEG